MHLAFEERGTCLVATLQADSFASYDARDYQPVFDEALRRMRPDQTLILDLSGVDYMRSSGLGAILKLLDSLRTIPARLVIASRPTLAKNMFMIAELPKIVPLYDNVEDALAAAGNASASGGAS